MENERKKHLIEVMKKINKETKSNFMDFAENKEDMEVIYSGIKSIDKFFGGFKRGTFSVLWGGMSVGKSTLIMQTIANCQKEGKLICYIDMERSFDKERARQLGVNLNELVLVSSCSTAEQALEIIRQLSKDKAVDAIFLDSIQAMSPLHEQENKGKSRDLSEKEMAELARTLSKFFRVVASDIYNAKIACILIGQVRLSLGSFIVRADLSGGECFDSNTRILTKKGLKKYTEVKIGDLIPTINIKKNKIEYKPIRDIYIYDYDGELNQFKNKYGQEFLFTDNHKCLVKEFKWDNIIKQSNLKSNNYKLIDAESFRQVFAFPICFPSGKKEFSITDDELKLLAWILTDGTIIVADKRKTNWKRYANRIEIYQSKIKYVTEIEQLLNKLNIKYTKMKRVRKDKRYLNKIFISYTFYIHTKNEIVKKYKLNQDKSIPDWFFKLSDRQTKILINGMIKGDGHYRKNKTWSYLCDGNKENLEKISLLCVTHNIPISKIIKTSHKKCWYLYFRQCNYFGFTPTMKQKQKYIGKIWDISVDNELHFIERNSSIIITHNSLKHWAYINCFMRRGQNSDAPVQKFKTYYLDPDGVLRYTTVSESIGFDCVCQLRKTKSSKSAKEGSEIHIPFLYNKGFVNSYNPNEKIEIRIDPELPEPEQEKIKEMMIEKGILKNETKDNCEKIAQKYEERYLDQTLEEVEQKDLINGTYISSNNEIPPQPKKKRGRPKKEKK